MEMAQKIYILKYWKIYKKKLNKILRLTKEMEFFPIMTKMG